MKKRNISDEYIKILKLLDDDDYFVKCFYFMPFTALDYLVPKSYLIRRTKYLIKIGKLKKKEVGNLK